MVGRACEGARAKAECLPSATVGGLGIIGSNSSRHRRVKVFEASRESKGAKASFGALRAK